MSVPPQRPPEREARRIGLLTLRRIVAVDERGVPSLEGTNARVLCAGRVAHGEVGRLAACQDAEDEAGPITFILGLVEEERPEDGPVVLTSGAASIALYPDGHIRMEGTDVSVDASGRLKMLAGRIDLN
ncbi:MAG: hypothetical protein ACU0CI_02765 [Shimia sp.]